MYRPPDNTTFLNQFSSTLDHIWMKRSNVTLLQDLNFNLLPEAQVTSLSIWKFRQLLIKFNLKNVINKATRITDNSTALIYLIICSDISKISHLGVCDLGIFRSPLNMRSRRLQKETSETNVQNSILFPNTRLSRSLLLRYGKIDRALSGKWSA